MNVRLSLSIVGLFALAQLPGCGGGSGGGNAAPPVGTPQINRLTRIADMTSPRSRHAATLLQDGRVLITGGFGAGVLASAEIFDPANDTFTATGSMAVARADHAATLLQDGRVLITGGGNSDPLVAVKSAEIFDPASGTFSMTGDMTGARSGHVATLRSDGRVVVLGPGRNGKNGHSVTAELFDPLTGQFTADGNPGEGFVDSSMTLMEDGRVLVAGGKQYAQSCRNFCMDGLASVPNTSLFQSSDGTFVAGPNISARAGQAAIALPDGTVLVGGGVDVEPNRGSFVTGYVRSALLFDPTNNSLRSLGTMHFEREQYGMVLLASGSVLLTGGFVYSEGPADAELIDPASGAFEEAGALGPHQFGFTTTALHDGRALIAGGQSGGGATYPAISQADVFR